MVGDAFATMGKLSGFHAKNRAMHNEDYLYLSHADARTSALS